MRPRVAWVGKSLRYINIRHAWSRWRGPVSKEMVILRFINDETFVCCDKEKQLGTSLKQAQSLHHGPTATVC